MFKFESELCQVLTANMLSALGGTVEATVMREVQVGAVIPDFVVVCGAARTWNAELTNFESWVVAELLRCRARRPETLSRRLFARQETTARALTRLERAGVLERNANESYSLCEDRFPRDSCVIAIEAKLERWRDAIDQAAEYRRFANKSYVALPRELVSHAPSILPACRERGLGLIEVSRDGVEIRRSAPKHQTINAGWVWLVARAYTSEIATVKRPLLRRAAKRADVQASFVHENLPPTRSS